MTLNLGADRITITDTDGSLIFDTNDKILHILPGLASGSRSYAALNWGSGTNPSTRHTDVSLGAVNSNAQVIFGLARITYSSGLSSLPSGAWYTVGGSILHEHKTFQSLSGTYGNFPSSMAALTFYLSGNTLRIKEDVVTCDDSIAGVNDNFAGYTTTYRIYAGAFT